MKQFMCKDFLLKTETAKKLYHEYAKEMPIFDYHCHLSAQEIAEDKSYNNMTEIWLAGDHYKWRAMRGNGIYEEYITGNKSDKEKFMKWAETVPYTLGNPLYHWTHLELKTYFNIDETLSPKTSEAIWEKCNGLLKTKQFTAKQLINKSNVKGLCTTDDPIDDLKYHIEIANDTDFDVIVLPTFRPDRGIDIAKESFIEWIQELQKTVGYKIDTYKKLLIALEERVDFFHEVGCRISDHGLDTIYFKETSFEESENIFIKKLNGESLTLEEIEKYMTGVLIFLGKIYCKKNWTMQLHLGTIRNNNKRMLEQAGINTGFDSIGDFNFAQELSNFLDSLDNSNELPQTILYSLNPKDNYVLGTMIGNFQGEGKPGKIQLGSGWWFNDQRDGMVEQMKSLANLGLLSRFVGMLTDSRSFLSYTRHEYFRRILCNLIGEWVENGEYPADFEMLENIVKGISYINAKNYFEIEL